MTAGSESGRGAETTAGTGRDPDEGGAVGGAPTDGEAVDGSAGEGEPADREDVEAPTDDDAGATAGDAEATAGEERAVVRVTAGLVDYLLDWAESAEPERLSVVLGSTPAGEFGEDLGLEPSVPVLTHVYLPDAGRSVNAVFGMDLGTPAGRGRARFVTHPQGPLRVTRRDDLAAVVLVAVPPWDRDSLAAFDRAGRRLDLRLLDAEPPHGELDAPE
jgi:hypothetical protein